MIVVRAILVATVIAQNPGTRVDLLAIPNEFSLGNQALALKLNFYNLKY